jgi:hypothetical protein
MNNLRNICRLEEVTIAYGPEVEKWYVKAARSCPSSTVIEIDYPSASYQRLPDTVASHQRFSVIQCAIFKKSPLTGLVGGRLETNCLQADSKLLNNKRLKYCTSTSTSTSSLEAT